MSGFLNLLYSTIRFGTRFHGPAKPEAPGAYSAALALQPLIGLLLGVAAAFLPLFITVNFRGLHGLMLFASGIYLFLLEWLTRFDNLHGFDAACRMLAGTDVPPEERLARLGQPGSSPCTALLVGLKLLLLYLIFLKTALYGDNMLLAAVLVTAPFFGRIAMLFCYPSSPGKQTGAVSLPIKLIWTLAALLLLAFLLGTLRTFGGNFFSFRSMKLTMSGFHANGNSGGVSPLIAIVSLGIQDSFSFFAAVFLAVMYWNTEAAKKLGFRPAPCFAGAVCETAELAVTVIFLILTDDLIFG